MRDNRSSFLARCRLQGRRWTNHRVNAGANTTGERWPRYYATNVTHISWWTAARQYRAIVLRGDIPANTTADIPQRSGPAMPVVPDAVPAYRKQLKVQARGRLHRGERFGLR